MIIKIFKKTDVIGLGPYLSTSEYHCKCKSDLCHFTLICEETVKAFTELRKEWGGPVLINSAFRCQSHNHKVGGVFKSQHTTGVGMDLRPMQGDLDAFAAMAAKHFNITIPYPQFVHCDMREL